MGKFSAATMSGGMDIKQQRLFNYLIELLDTGYVVEGLVGGHNIRIDLNAKDGLKGTNDGVQMFGLDPVTGQFTLGAYDAEIDGKVTTFAQDAAPTAIATGDLWYDTNDSNKLYRWDGDSWETVRDAATVDKSVSYAGVTIDAVNGFISSATIGGKAVSVKLNSTTGLAFYDGTTYRGGLAVVNGELSLVAQVLAADPATLSVYGIIGEDPDSFTHGLSLFDTSIQSKQIYEVSIHDLGYSILVHDGTSIINHILFNVDAVYGNSFSITTDLPNSLHQTVSRFGATKTTTSMSTQDYVTEGVTNKLEMDDDGFYFVFQNLDLLIMSDTVFTYDSNNIWHNGNLPVASATFTPALVGSSTAGTWAWTSQTGNYYKIGNICYITAYLRPSSISGSPAGYLRLTGLPFNAGVSSQLMQVMCSGVAWGTNMTQIQVYVDSGNSYGTFYGSYNNGAYAAVDVGNVSASDTIIIHGWYRTA